MAVPQSSYPPPPLITADANATATTLGGTPIGSAQASAPTPTVTFPSSGLTLIESTATPLPLGTNGTFPPPGPSGTNSFVTFTPPNASGEQQNSGNASSLPSGINLLGGTNQTNSATNAGSLVGPGTTQLPITNSTITAKKSNSISLSPYSGSIDPVSSTGLTKYNNFVKSPYNDRIDCSMGNGNLILAALSEKAEQYSFGILWVPTSGSG
jgi:hypothetical protein